MNNSKTLSFSDIFFVVCIAILLGFGVKFSSTNGRVLAFAPSLLCGSGISLLVYYFLGGIEQNGTNGAKVNLGIASVKLTGSFGALVGSTMIFNNILVEQMNNITLETNPKSVNGLLVLDRQANPKPLKILGKGGGVSTDKVIETSKDDLKTVKDLCREGKGFCKENLEKAKFTINPKLKYGYALLCSNVNKFHLSPLMISGDHTIPLRVTAIADKNCESLDQDNPPLLIEVGEQYKEALKIKDRSEGFYTIPSFRVERPADKDIAILNEL